MCSGTPTPDGSGYVANSGKNCKSGSVKFTVTDTCPSSSNPKCGMHLYITLEKYLYFIIAK